ncbi:ATP-binding protein [Pseudomonas sp. NPDC007930]|uniref:ATP-binding protein n=1 Tax=Pseudomonas sp. NPDC007930 TaxID=3364417 RepID=UPI0036E1CC53
MRRWLPASLYGRMVLIMIGGVLLAQLVTSTVWFDVRHAQSLEIPTRLVATHLADIVRVAEREPDQVDHLSELLRAPGFSVQVNAAPTHPDVPLDVDSQAAEDLLRSVLAEKTGQPQTFQLLRLELLDQAEHKAGLPVLLSARPTVGRFLIDLRLPDGRWLLVDAQESQGWSPRASGELIADYVLRIYLLRILLVLAVTLFAVRWAIAPLKRLAAAAHGLGRNIQQAPLPEQGPSEVRQACAAFNTMQRQLSESLGQRTRFLAAVSHDLRSPLTRMRLRTERIDDATVRGMLQQDLEHMRQMVDATLEFVTSGETREPQQRIDLNALLMSLEADFTDQGQAVTVQGRASAPARGYARSLHRCLHNLIENAVRHAGAAEVSLAREGAYWRVTVADRGPGIDEAALAKVTEPFLRLDAARQSEGYGLGLAIADAVAKAHGGRLTLRNREGGGLQALLDLPA